MPPTGTAEIEATAATPEQVVSSVAPKIESGQVNPSDDVLELIKESTEDGVPSGAPAQNAGELWTAKPTPTVAETEVSLEQVAAPLAEQPKNEAAISMDSPFMATEAPISPSVEAKDEAFGEDVTLDFAPAENMIKVQAEDANRGIHQQMAPEFKATLTESVAQGAEVATTKLEQVGAEIERVDQIEDPEERLKARESSLAMQLDRVLADLDDMEKTWDQRGIEAETKAQTEIAEAEAEAAEAQADKALAEEKIITANNKKIQAQNRLEEEKGRIAAEKTRIDAKRQNVLELKK